MFIFRQYLLPEKLMSWWYFMLLIVWLRMISRVSNFSWITGINIQQICCQTCQWWKLRKISIDSRMLPLFTWITKFVDLTQLVVVVMQTVREHLEWFSVECGKTKTKLITLANHKEHTIQWTNHNWKQLQVADGRSGKTRASESRLVLVLLLIG